MMNKEKYIEDTKTRFTGKSRDLVLKQIELFYNEDNNINKNKYDIGEDKSIKDVIDELTTQMLVHASKMEFEEAAKLRDEIQELEKMI